MIKESTIESIVELLESEDLENEVSKMGEAQPALISFLMQESYEVLKEDEKEYLFYIFLVIYRAFTKSQSIGIIDGQIIQEMEEQNWEMWESVQSRSIRDRNTLFFRNYEEEDLLAFVEDMVLDDEEEQLSKVAQEIGMIAGKTLIDCFASQL